MGGAIGFLRVALVISFTASMVLAVAIDARSRRFPNHLAAVMAFEALSLAMILHPFSRFIVRVVFSLIIFAVLFAFEMIWRFVLKREGMGVGDAKAIAILAIISPAGAIAAFCASMVVLVLICALRKLESLPLLPMLLPIFSIVMVCWPAIWGHLDAIS